MWRLCRYRCLITAGRRSRRECSAPPPPRTRTSCTMPKHKPGMMWVKRLGIGQKLKQIFIFTITRIVTKVLVSNNRNLTKEVKTTFGLSKHMVLILDGTDDGLVRFVNYEKLKHRSPLRGTRRQLISDHWFYCSFELYHLFLQRYRWRFWRYV